MGKSGLDQILWREYGVSGIRRFNQFSFLIKTKVGRYMAGPIRVLQITDCIMHYSGVAAVIMNYYRHIDLERVIFDFMVFGPVDEYLRQEIEGKGSKIYMMPEFCVKNTVRNKKLIEDFFQDHGKEYKIVHGHTPNAAAYYLLIAKKYGVPIRIVHSHNSRGADSTIKRVRNRIMSRVAIASATDRFACSKVAAEYLYGDENAFIINNGIDLDEYTFSPDIRTNVRNRFKIDDDAILVGHVGRMVPQKNQGFIVDMADKLRESDIHFKIILIGDGPLKSDIESKIQSKNLNDYFIFTGVVDNTKPFYQAMDAFVLPSLYEGLPVVGVEAQASGLPTLVSTNVTPETLMADNIQVMEIDDAGKWAQWIIDNSGNRMDNRSKLVEAGFDISKNAECLEDMYRQLLTLKGLL